MRNKVVLACEVCSSRNYTTSKNKDNQTERLESKKYCKTCGNHTIHRETK
ncbi:50S ribosomal protein L33 [Radiobacillus deserti]|uniref:Large ribosomal subunit protein bL33 n=1 Tax=Radiobacillus deserti TaxID=2594883 RepID=A0A516KBV6_9BACI|nr:50S ribosomal protein L33 [Radiobacillus deserti]QDP38870.1 50S ribosomal protein L33 [Radiobacillus deserti]